jgi:hypothetical protein
MENCTHGKGEQAGKQIPFDHAHHSDDFPRYTCKRRGRF